MRKIREVLRLKWVLGRGHRDVSTSLDVSLGVVSSILARASGAGLTWPEVEKLTDEELEHRLYGGGRVVGGQRPLPDPAFIHAERRKTGVTLELLHAEYLAENPGGYQYTQFCEYYRRWAHAHRQSMKQIHKAGEKLFVDYSGKKPKLVNPDTGVVWEAELFVAVLGASNYTYAEATRTQESQDWIGSHVRAFEFMEGVAGALVPDQLKAGVTQPCRYEPGIQRTYEEMARHYNTVVLPARPGKSKDKAKVEVGVLIAQRWILACLRNLKFFSLDELNEHIAALCEKLNDKRMRLYGVSRRELFARVDKPALKRLPADRFVYAVWKAVRPNIDYHVEFDHHYYSVPHWMTHEREGWEVRATGATVEVYRRGQRIAGHARSYVRGAHTTIAEHMPQAHRAHLEWSPSRIMDWAGTIGPKTREIVQTIIEERPHPEQGYRSCLGILRLAKRYAHDRVERACARALVVGARSYRHIESILKNGLDRLPLPEKRPLPAPALVHENIRGPEYYSVKEEECSPNQPSNE